MRGLKGKYKQAMESGYYPPMSYDDWLYNIEGVAVDTNMEIEVAVYLESDKDDGEPIRIDRTYAVCASEDDDTSVYFYARNKVKEEYPEYMDIEILSYRWL